MSDVAAPQALPGMPCPRCRVDLVMSDRQGIEIDYCPKCRGVWLDRGELDKVIERSAQYAAAPAPTQDAAPAPPAQSPWVAPPATPPGYAPAGPPPGWGQGYDTGHQGGHGGGHGGGYGGGHGGSGDAGHNSFLGRLFR